MSFLSVGSQRQGTPWEPGLSLEKNLGIRSRREDWESEIHDWKENLWSKIYPPKWSCSKYNSTIRKNGHQKKTNIQKTRPKQKKHLPFICRFFNEGNPNFPIVVSPNFSFFRWLENQVSTGIFDANLLETCTRWASACRGPPDSELEGPGRRNKILSHEKKTLKNTFHYIGWLIGILTMAYNITIYDIYIYTTGSIIPYTVYTLNNQGFVHCSNDPQTSNSC